jgi:localization factor PodJL
VADAGDIPDLPEAIGTPALRQAAIGGDPIAQFEVASRLAEGRGVEADAEAAAAWYRRAAASGLAPAQYRLGSLYEKGVGVIQDRDAARVWYERGAAQGNRKAMHNLAVLHADGIDGQPDFEAAARWFRAAADLGLSDSQYNLGILFARGLGVPQNFSESYKWFSILANRGDKDATIRRDAVAEKLDPQTLAAAKLAAQTWKAKHLDPEANAVRLPNEGWALQLDQGASAQPGADIVRNAQKLLSRLGYEPGPTDGQWGPKTKGAIESFQRDAGLQPTGALTPDLLRKLQQQASS